MEANIKSGQDEPLALIQYGLQRTSTNYIQQLILGNFSGLKFFNRNKSRFLPLHKHFRLYDDKFFIPSKEYYNSFYYEDFLSFRKHVDKLAGVEINRFIISIKHPYSWYLSFMKHARKNGYELNKRAFNPHFIWDYNHFYVKWIEFKKESPEAIDIIKYEDIISDVSQFLTDFGKSFGMYPGAGSISNPSKVSMSKKFTTGKKNFYTEEKFMDKVSDEYKRFIYEILDERILEFYHLVD